MSETNITPGPWEAPRSPYRTSEGEGALFSEGDWYVTPPMGERGPVACAGSKADAHLIAAAPELYEALKAMVEEADEDHHPQSIYADVLAKARAALAQASPPGKEK